MMNRVEVYPVDVLVDHWPDFNVLLIRPQQKENADLFKDNYIFTKDEASLRNMLIRTDIFDWKQYFCLSVDLRHMEMVKNVGLNQGVTNIRNYMFHQMTLRDPSKLTTERLPLQVSSLNESHVDLVNRTWKYGMGEFSGRLIRNMIVNFPSFCVLDAEGRPVSWILTYASGGMGMLYTLLEHRRKGYAKALVTIMAKKLHSEGYPVYCLIEEDNETSYRLFTSLGFTTDPSYRVAWLECNDGNSP
ncbi:glycine N-acyltransferase-like protein 3 isoform 2-T2 [Clarias gariepinus]